MTLKKSDRIGFDRILLRTEIVISVVYFLILPLRNISYRHVIVFLGSVGFYFIAFNKIAVSRIRIIDLFCLFFIILCIVLGLCLSIPDLSMELVYSALNFLTFILILTTNTQPLIDEKTEKWINSAIIIIGISLVYNFYSPAAYLFEDGRSTGALVLGMTNPNFAGIMLFAVYVLAVLAFREKRFKGVWLLLSAVMLYFMILTRARSSLIAALFFSVYAVFFSNKRIPNWIVCMMIIIPILAVPAYLYLYSSQTGNFILLGKRFFSGREKMYYEFLHMLSSGYQFVIGNYKDVHLANAHNAELSIFCSIGSVGALSTYICFIRKMLLLNSKRMTDTGRVALAAILSFFIQSSAEALMFTGYFIATFFLYLFLLIISKNTVSVEAQKAV